MNKYIRGTEAVSPTNGSWEVNILSFNLLFEMDIEY